MSLEAFWVLDVQVRSFPAVITEVTLDPRHICKRGREREGGEDGGAAEGGGEGGDGNRGEVDIFHLFSKADPLSNLCGLRLLDRLIHYGWFSLDCRYMLELRAVQRRRKEQRDKIWIAKIPFLSAWYKPRSFYRFLNGRRKKTRARPRDHISQNFSRIGSKLVADSRYFANKNRVVIHNRQSRDVKFY